MKYLLCILALLVVANGALAQSVQEAPFQYQDPPKQDPLQVIFDTGKRAFGERLYDAAIRYFTEYLEKAGDNLADVTAGSDYLAQSWLLSGKPQKALEVIQALERKALAPLSSSMRYLKARAFASLKEWQAAYDTLAPVVLPADSTLPLEATLLCADCLMEQRKWLEMEEFVLGVNKIHSDLRQNIQVQCRLAEAQIALQKYELAMETVERIDPPQEGSKERLRYDMLKVRVLALLNQVDSALKEYERANMTSLTSGSETQRLWQMLGVLADSLYAAARYQDALPIYQRAIELAADNAQKRHSMEYMIRIYVAIKANKDELIRALEEFGKTFPASPEEIELTELYAQSLYEEKNYYEATERFEKLCSLNPEPNMLYNAYLNIGKCYRFQGNIDGSVEAFEKAEAYGGDDAKRAEALFQAANVAEDYYSSSQGNSDEQQKLKSYATLAITLFKRVASQYPKDERAPVSLFKEASLLFNLGAFKEAVVEYARITSDYQTSDKFEESLLMQGMCMRRFAASSDEKLAANRFLSESTAKMTPNSLFIDWAQLEAAQAAEEAGDAELAEKTLTSVVESGSAEKMKEALFHLAMLQFNVSKDDEARKNAELFFDKYPADPLFDELCILTGDSYANQGDWDLAAKYYIMPLAVTPVRNPRITPFALYETAHAAFNLGRYSDALNHLSALIANLSPQGDSSERATNTDLLARAFFLRGDTYAKLLDYANASEAFNDCFRESTSSNLKYSALGRRGEMLLQLARKGPVSEHIDKFQEAEQCFREIIHQEGVEHPLAMMARYYLAFSLNCQDKTQEAIKEYEDFYTSFGERASRQTPVDTYYFANAIQELAEIFEKDEKNPESLKKAQHYYEVLMKANLPTSATAKERYLKLMNVLNGK